MNLKRYTDNHTVNFVKFLVGLRGPATSVSASERKLLADVAASAKCIVEVGVFEGATSRILCQKAAPGATVYLVDPFFPDVFLERLLNVSFTRWVAQRTVRSWQERVRFVRQPSREAAAALSGSGQADLIFIDARHDYQSVYEDFQSWTPMLAPQGTLAFHDSRVCTARTDLTDDTGPVRLVREIENGQHGPWKVVATADSVTAFRLVRDKEAVS